MPPSPYTTLISCADLVAHLEDPAWAVVDCRFSLEDPPRGRRDYLLAHIPGAVYAHLDEDLAAPVIPGKTGRHPLPSMEHLTAAFSRWGIGKDTQVVAYDDWSAAPGGVAARLWWLLRWLGHDAVAVLDGGWARWQLEGRPAAPGVVSRPPAQFIPHPRPELIAADVNAMRRDPACRVVDSRANDRYRGQNETVDPIAGHIPGALNLPYAANVGADGLFLPPAALRRRFHSTLGEVRPGEVAFYCGSGVTAAHNVLAYLHAGLGEARLYPGSWSEWIVLHPHEVEV
jgi:thiosulfate/3-mercaptopyruvate sulfurtransferase